MKLYYTPGACSLSPHIVLNETGLDYELEKVDLRERRTEAGHDFKNVNPRGYVPALVLENGDILTEGPAIVQYLADQKPESKLAPPHGTMERYHLMEMLNMISTELHKQYSPLFYPTTPDATKKSSMEKLSQRYDFLSKHLEGKQYLFGDQFTVADAYLFTVTTWAKKLNFDLSKWPVILEFQKRVAARPAVQKALKEEGLI